MAPSGSMTAFTQTSLPLGLRRGPAGRGGELQMGGGPQLSAVLRRPQVSEPGLP